MITQANMVGTSDKTLPLSLSYELNFMTHSSQPGELVRLVELQEPKTIFLDEIQRLPNILNTVQALIDRDKSLKFYLTGSSARKLKRGGANSLPAA